MLRFSVGGGHNIEELNNHIVKLSRLTQITVYTPANLAPASARSTEVAIFARLAACLDLLVLL